MRPRQPRAAVLLVALVATACSSPSPTTASTSPSKETGAATTPRSSVGTNTGLTPSATPSAGASAPGTTAPNGGAVSPPRTLASLSGVVLAPSTLVAAGGGNLVGLDGGTMVAAGGGNLIGMDGSTLVAAGGGNLVAAGGGNLVAAGGLNFRLAQAGALPVKRAKVALAIGDKLLPIPPVETDENGAYRFPQVPTGVTCQVVVAIETPGGKTGRLMALAKAAPGGSVADVSPATTMVTAAVVAENKAIGDVEPAKFQAATERAAALLAQVTDPTQVPDLGEQKALIGVAKDFLAKDPDLKATIAELVTAVATAPLSAEAASTIVRDQAAAGCPIAEPLPAAIAGAAAADQLAEPGAIAVAPDGAVYVGDRPNKRVLKLMGGKAEVALKGVEPLALLVDDGYLYVANGATGGLVKQALDKLDGTDTTSLVLPPDTFVEPVAMVRGPNRIFVADAAKNRIYGFPVDGRAIDLEIGGKPGYAEGEGTTARFYRPVGLAVDETGKRLLVADAGNRRIRAIALAEDGRLATSTVAGGGAGSADGAFADARFGQPVAIVREDATKFWVADATNGTLRRLDVEGKKVETLFGGCAVRAGGQAIAGGLAFGGDYLVYVDGERVMRRQVRFGTPAPTPTPTATPSAEATATPSPTPTPTPTATPSP